MATKVTCPMACLRTTQQFHISRICCHPKVKVTFDLENSNAKVMAKVKPIGHIWGLEFNRYVCFSFRGNRTTFGWDIANSIFGLEISRSRSWPRSHMMVTFEAWGSIDTFAFRFVAIKPFLAEVGKIPYLTLKFQGQGHSQGQTRWSHLRPWDQSICLLLVSWQSDHFWLRYSKFHIWLWKFKVKVMVKVKPDGHIWGLEFNRWVCFLFRGNQTVFGWHIANSIFEIENSRSRSLRK